MMQLTPRDYEWKRHHRQQSALFYLQLVFFTAALACMIAIVWNLSEWIRIAVMVVLLLFAGAACKSGRT
jgi:uncharacterized membrane protein